MKYEFGLSVFGIRETKICEFAEDTPIEEVKEVFDDWRFNKINSWMTPVKEGNVE